jgi:lipoate synthase
MDPTIQRRWLVLEMTVVTPNQSAKDALRKNEETVDRLAEVVDRTKAEIARSEKLLKNIRTQRTASSRKSGKE